MTWLIKLYPPAWRRRYGRELADLISTQPASFGTTIDLIAGAVDAWLNPQSSTAAGAANAKGAGSMIPRILKHRSDISTADSLKAAGVTIGGTLSMALAVTWAMAHYGKNDYFEALLAVCWVFPVAFSERYTYLKGRPAAVQAVVIGGISAIAMGIVLGAVWLNNH